MIYVIKNKNNLYACTNNYKQAIFDFNGTLGLSNKIKQEEIKLLKRKNTFSKLEKTAIKHNIPITLCDKQGRQRINERSNVIITETDQPLELLARHATNHTQFGFLKDEIKVLYGKDLGLRHIPEYFKGFFTAGSRKELSFKVHELLIDYLQNFNYKKAGKLIKKYTKLDLDSFASRGFFSLFNLRKGNTSDKNKKELGRILVKGKEEELYNIRTILSLPTFTYKHIPYLDVRCNKKDEKKIEKELKQKYEAAIAKTITLPATSPVQILKPTYTNLVQIGAYEAQNFTKGEGIRVGVIDTGVDYEHEQLKHSFEDLKGYDFVHETAAPQDDNGHGSHVAGIIAGIEVGAAPHCSLYALKALDARGSGSEADILSAIDWAIENDIHVLNMSLGSSHASNAERAAINAALEYGIIIAAAAGNDGDTSYSYPASYAGVLSIAAVNHKNEHAWFSNKNDRLFISAPGVDIFSCYKNNHYIEMSGTSMATPHAAGAAALALSVSSSAHLEEVLEATAQELSAGQDARLYGAGLVRADSAVASMLQPAK